MSANISNDESTLKAQIHKNFMVISEQASISNAVINTRALRLEECQQKLSRTKILQNKWSILYLLNKLSEQSLASGPTNNLSVGSLFLPEPIDKYDTGVNPNQNTRMEIERLGPGAQGLAPKKNAGTKEQHAKAMDKQFMRE
jgi:hypothetical protein